jgi:hypothetical protein
VTPVHPVGLKLADDRQGVGLDDVMTTLMIWLLSQLVPGVPGSQNRYAVMSAGSPVRGRKSVERQLRGRGQHVRGKLGIAGNVEVKLGRGDTVAG